MKNILINKIYKIDEHIKDECLCNTLTQCCDYDKMHHPHFLEDDFSLYQNKPCLYYALIKANNKKEPAGHLSIYLIDDSNLEMCVFVRPEYRNKNIMNELFNLLKSDYKGYRFLLPINANNDTGIAIAKKKGFQYSSTEYKMELNLNNIVYSNVGNIEIKFKDNCYYAYLLGNNIGVCMIEEISDTLICLYDIQIYSEYRGLGYGEKMLKSVLLKLSTEKSTAILHVTKENHIACKLYEKLGFKITERTAYYFYQNQNK